MNQSQRRSPLVIKSAIAQIYSDLLFDSYAGLYGYNDRMLITEYYILFY